MSRADTVALADTPVPAQGDIIVALHQFARVLGGGASLDEILRQALLSAARLTELQHATVLLLDEQSERIRYRVALANGNVAPLALVAGPMMSRGLAGWVVRTRRAALVPDTEQDPRWLPGPGSGDLRSAIVAPLIVGDRTWGIITLAHETPAHYCDEHLRLLEILGAQVALAIAHTGQRARPHPTTAQVLQAAPGRPARREIVALSAELRGLTAGGATLAPAIFFDEMLRTYLHAMTEIVHRHSGAVDSAAGDALLAIFDGAAGANDAVLAALQMQALARQLRAQWRERLGVEVGGVDIGLARGPATVGRVDEHRAAVRAFGDVVGAAARLRGLARGEILAAATVAAALQSDATFIVAALPPLRLDTITEPIFSIAAPANSRPAPAMGQQRPRS